MEPAIALTDCNSFERDALLDRFLPKIKHNPQLDRSLVSFQANRKVPFYSWFKYKEGFSTSLVESLIRRSGKESGLLLDPFAGAGTALLVSQSLGWDSIGIELLPIGPYVMEARAAAHRLKAKTFRDSLNKLPATGWAKFYDPEFAFAHIEITKGAFPQQTERAIAGYRSFINRSVRNQWMRLLLDFACFSILETVSYTRKDGQYLRWDYRSRKERVTSKFDKGRIVDFDTAIVSKLENIYADLSSSEKQSSGELFAPNKTVVPGTIDLRVRSCLSELRKLETYSVDTVLTSPPYCNRYDYTRTYALELAYLGFDTDAVKNLRQQMLSCTVENRSKINDLEKSYSDLARRKDFAQVVRAFEGQSALTEVLDILDRLNSNDELNNANIPRMVRNYFLEMCFVVFELSRVMKKGGEVVMVNDNVRYGGEEIPVDLILSDFAERFGLRVRHIWTLARGKGNSSQQMGLHGRSELRKCVYVWEKP